MSYFITGSGLMTEYTKLTDNALTDLLRDSRGQTTTVAGITCTETVGGTPVLTIAVHDPDDLVSYYLRNAAMTANETYMFCEPVVVPGNWKLRVSSSAVGGGIDVLLNYFNPDAAGRGIR